MPPPPPPPGAIRPPNPGIPGVAHRYRLGGQNPPSRPPMGSAYRQPIPPQQQHMVHPRYNNPTGNGMTGNGHPGNGHGLPGQHQVNPHFSRNPMGPHFPPHPDYTRNMNIRRQHVSTYLKLALPITIDSV